MASSRVNTSTLTKSIRVNPASGSAVVRKQNPTSARAASRTRATGIPAGKRPSAVTSRSPSTTAASVLNISKHHGAAAPRR